MPDSPPIRYSKLVCLITGHDAEWSRRPASKAGDGEASLDKAFNRVFAEVERMCTEFRTNLNKFAQLAYPERCAGEAGEWEVPAHFFRPLRYQPVGHADAMSVTIFDDLDPIHSLTARCTTTVEEVAVGFAPFVDSLRREPWPAPFDGCLVDVEEFVRLGAVTEEHPVQELPPLLLFSRIKLGALGLLGQGIEFQTAVFRAIVSDCLTGLKTLHALAEGDGLAEFEADQESVTSCRIALLDLQGQEEIGLLIATDNYSVAGALLSRIQGLRLNELPQQPARPLKIEAQPWLLKARELLMDMTGETGPGGGFEKTAFDESIMNSHALRWTRSTLAMRQDVFKDPVGTRVRGYIDMVSAANIAVGHQEKLDEALKEMQDSAAPPGTDAARVQAAGQKEEHSGPPEAFRLQLMGHADLLVHQNHPGRNRLRLIKTRQALAQVRELIEKMSDTEGADKQMPRHLAGLSSWPTVPVPKHDDFRRKLKSHYPVLQKILPVLRWRMVDFRDDDGEDDGGLHTVPDEDERLGITERRQVKQGRTVQAGLCSYTLCSEPKKYLAPSSLVRTVQYLYQNYNTLLANPFVFDTVLDLYDCFATFHAILTKHLPALYGARQRGGNKGVADPEQIPAEVVSQLSRYMSALHRAMEQRLYRAFPEDANRDMDVDFRGGLNQLISGGDALVKSAMGFVKRYALPKDTFAADGETDVDTRFDLFGVVNRIDFEPEIVATSLWLGTEDKARLTIIRSDVPHLCVVASYLDFIHEVGHIVFAEHRHPRAPGPGRPERAPLLPLVPVRSATEELLGEIYTHTLTTLLVCREDPETFAKHSMVGFALATRHGADLPSRYGSFLRFSFQVFIASHCVTAIKEAAGQTEAGWGVFASEHAALGVIEEMCRSRHEEEHRDDRSPDKNRDEEAYPALRNKFRAFINEVGCVCHDYATYQKHDEDQAILDANFDYHWACIRYSLPILIANVVTVYMRFVARMARLDEDDPADAENIADAHKQMTKLEGKVREALQEEKNQGIPVIHVAQEQAIAMGYDRNRYKREDRDKDRDKIGVFHLTTMALGAALRFRMAALKLDQEFQVPINRDSGNIHFEKERTAKAKLHGYSEYLIRPKDSFLFCCLPYKRRERLQRQIALLKTLWNTASQIKARRFEALIKNSISKEAGPDKENLHQFNV